MKLPNDWPREDSLTHCDCGYPRGIMPLHHACAECGVLWSATLKQRRRMHIRRLHEAREFRGGMLLLWGTVTLLVGNVLFVRAIEDVQRVDAMDWYFVLAPFNVPAMLGWAWFTGRISRRRRRTPSDARTKWMESA